MPKKEKPCIGKTFNVGSFSVVVEDVIAEGGFALVFLVRDNNGRRYALKRMYVNTEKDLGMCQQEIHILELLAKDPDSHVVRFWASSINVIDEEVKEVLILLDYYKASVLQLMNERFQTKRQLSEEEVLNIFCDVCHAVGKLHTQRVPWIHRDLKVENILIDKNGRCVLCDFGSATDRILDPFKHSIADIEEELKKYTTIAYRSPEMVNLYGYKKPISTKADIWALGVMLYKMCYFVLPFGESSLAIQNCNLQFPDKPSYSKQLQGLIRYCLKVDPDDRPDIFQITTLACWMANRECAVINRGKVQVPAPEILLSLAEAPPVASVETSPPRILRPASSAHSHEFSSSTSIAPRERPKASSTSAAALVLPPPPSKFQGSPLTPVNVQANFPSESPAISNNGASSVLIDISSTANTSVGSSFPPVTGMKNGANVSEAGQRTANFRLGHRRNTSDTSMIPMARPASPAPTQNTSEKSRSADTSPVRSPNPRTDVDKKFAAWNPFEDAENWHNIPRAPSFTQSISSLVRRGSVSSASKGTLISPAENGDKEKSKAKSGEKKEKKKFKYQKFDNDSDEEGGGSVSDQLISQSDGESKRSTTKKDTSVDESDTVKDTDSIGSASDLKHEDDTTDEEHLATQRPSQPEISEPKPEEDDEDEHYETVQYGTLEETASAIQSLASQRSVTHETSTKPLLDDNNGFDKSDEDELENRRLPPAAQQNQRRLTFEGMNLLSVFDQIPFRQPKKPKDLLVPGKKDLPRTPLDPVAFSTPQGTPHVFHDTNPFADCLVTPKRQEKVEPQPVEKSEKLPPVIAPPPVPPKPSFLKRELLNVNAYSPNYSTDSGEDLFGSSPFDSLTESLVLEEKPTVPGAASVKKKSRSPAFQDAVVHHSNVVTPVSPRTASKSPTRSAKYHKFQKKEGISNISFEDA